MFLWFNIQKLILFGSVLSTIPPLVLWKWQRQSAEADAEGTRQQAGGRCTQKAWTWRLTSSTKIFFNILCLNAFK